MKQIKPVDLVGQDVQGIKANVTRQGGKFHYDYQDVPRIRTLIRVRFRTIQGVKWLEWFWEPKHSGMYSDCGWSGIADSEYHKINEAYIFISKN